MGGLTRHRRTRSIGAAGTAGRASVARCLVAAVAALAFGAAPALGGEAILAVTAGASPELVLLDAAAPGTPLLRTPVIGLLLGETVAGIDQRPASGEVFVLTSTNRVLVLDPVTGVASQLGPGIVTTPALTAASAAGLDFNPAVDRLRIGNAFENNLRYNPVSLAAVDADGNAGNGINPDTALEYISGDPNDGADPNLTGAAYDRNDNDPATPTTLFGIDSVRDVLVRQGAIDGNAGDGAGGGSPNAGLLTTLASLGVDVTDIGGIDITRGPAGSGAGVGWAGLQRQGDPASTLYTVGITPTAGAGPRLSAVGGIGAPPVAGLTVLRGGILRAAAASAAEGAQAIVTVERVGDSLDPVSVGFRTADLTATAGSDYSAVSGILVFGQGERTQQVPVSLLRDGAVEGAQSFAFELGTPTGGASVLTRAATVEIADVARLVALTAPIVPDSLRALRASRALRVDFTCSDRCTMRATLAIGRAQIGTGLAVRSTPGVGRLVVRLSNAGRTRLARLVRARGGKVAVTLRTTAIDASGTTSARRTVLRLTRR